MKEQEPQETEIYNFENILDKMIKLDLIDIKLNNQIVKMYVSSLQMNDNTDELESFEISLTGIMTIKK